MNDSSQPFFNQIDVTNIVPSPGAVDERYRTEQRHAELLGVLNDIAAQQKRQNELLTQLINLQTAPQRQRVNELQAWRNSHPELAKGCRQLLDRMSSMQNEYFTKMVEESAENSEDWDYSEFMFNDFVDRFGPRLIHINTLLQALSQLAAPPEKDK